LVDLQSGFSVGELRQIPFKGRQVNMATSKTSTEVLPIGHHSSDEWLEVTPGERFMIRTSAVETNGVYTMIEIFAEPGNGVPMHIHQNEDEHFIVLEGTLHIAVGDKAVNVAAGRAVTVSRGVPHAWSNVSDTEVRMLVLFSPGQIEGMFREIAVRKNDDIAAILDKFGCLIVGPPPSEGLNTFHSPRSR
jgi:quercetin dioxygenase-like cupin family protein